VHLVGYIIRNFHDARSRERQIHTVTFILYFSSQIYLLGYTGHKRRAISIHGGIQAGHNIGRSWFLFLQLCYTEFSAISFFVSPFYLSNTRASQSDDGEILQIKNL
jgi:hypothetical protein